MKNFMLILSAAVLMMLAACSKKQTPKPVITLTPQNATAKDITGKWLATVDTIYTTVNNKTSAQPGGNTDGTFFQFNADGTGVEGDGTTPAELTFTFKVSGGAIIILSSSGDLSCNILEITSTKLGFSVIDSGGQEDIYFIKD